jgi:hypothetical protein
LEGHKNGQYNFATIIDGGWMQQKKYDPAVELAKGAKLTASSYDRTQTIKVKSGLVTVGGEPGVFEIGGKAAGRVNGSIDGTINVWLAIFRYMRPDGSTNHVAGWNIMVSLEPGQAPETTAAAFAAYINSGKRPYRAEAEGARVSVTYTGEGK